jgi:uncharacterized protein
MSDVFAVPGRSSRLDRVLHDLLRRVPELQAAAVVSFDGLPMASALPFGFDEDRVAAMSAALLSLGERASQGLGRGSLNQVYVEGEEGTVFLVSCEDEAVLVAVGAHGAKVGLLLFEVRRGALAVAETLRHEDIHEIHGYVAREVTERLPVHVAGHEPQAPAVYAQPAVAPGPVAQASAPTAQSPAPIASAPAAVVQAPAQVVQAPAPVVQAPAPVAQAPVIQAPAPVAPVQAPSSVHTPSYSNVTGTPAYSMYDGLPAVDADADDLPPVPVGSASLDSYLTEPYVAEPYIADPYVAEPYIAEQYVAEQYLAPTETIPPIPTPTSELGSWATFTPGGSLSAANGHALEPWI